MYCHSEASNIEVFFNRVCSESFRRSWLFFTIGKILCSLALLVPLDDNLFYCFFAAFYPCQPSPPALRQAVKVFTHFVFPAVKFLSEICSLRKKFSRNNAGIGQLQPYRLDLRQAVKVFTHFVFFLIKLKINEIY